MRRGSGDEEVQNFADEATQEYNAYQPKLLFNEIEMTKIQNAQITPIAKGRDKARTEAASAYMADEK